MSEDKEKWRYVLIEFLDYRLDCGDRRCFLCDKCQNKLLDHIRNLLKQEKLELLGRIKKTESEIKDPMSYCKFIEILNSERKKLEEK
jgi:hypothetical protein